MCFRKFDQWKLTRATDTFQSEPELYQSSKQQPHMTVKGRSLRVFSAIYAKDALKYLSSTESHFFKLEIYLEKHSNWKWLEYFMLAFWDVCKHSHQHKKAKNERIKKFIGSQIWTACTTYHYKTGRAHCGEKWMISYLSVLH